MLVAGLFYVMLRYCCDVDMPGLCSPACTETLCGHCASQLPLDRCSKHYITQLIILLGAAEASLPVYGNLTAAYELIPGEATIYKRLLEADLPPALNGSSPGTTFIPKDEVRRKEQASQTVSTCRCCLRCSSKLWPDALLASGRAWEEGQHRWPSLQHREHAGSSCQECAMLLRGARDSKCLEAGTHTSTQPDITKHQPPCVRLCTQEPQHRHAAASATP
jgi:hypothetical protein